MTRDELARALPQALIEAGLAHPMNADKHAYSLMRALYPTGRVRSWDQLQRLKDYGVASLGRLYSDVPGRTKLPQLQHPSRFKVAGRRWLEAHDRGDWRS